MPKTRAVAVAFGVIFSFALAASAARADSVHSANLSGSLSALDSLDLPDVSRAEEHSALFAGVLPGNGKHLGFSVAAFRHGPQLGIVRPNSPTVTQNPEPATMLLLGTGLAAVGAFIRRRRRA